MSFEPAVRVMDYAIIKYYVTFLHEKSPVYEKVSNPKISRRTEITRTQALEYIRTHNLEEVYKSKYGTIWDTPDRKWTNRWKGAYIRKKNKARKPKPKPNLL